MKKTASAATENLGAQKEITPLTAGRLETSRPQVNQPTSRAKQQTPSEEAATTEESNTGGQPAEPPSLLARLWQALESLAEGFWQSDSVKDDEIQGEFAEKLNCLSFGCPIYVRNRRAKFHKY